MPLASNTLNVLGPCLTLLSFILLSSIPAVLRLVRHLVQRRTSGQQDDLSPPSPLYCDDDGEATPASVRNFSNKWQRIVIGLLSVGGLGVSLTDAILSMKYRGVDDFPIHAWIHLAMWVGGSGQYHPLILRLTVRIARPLYVYKLLLYSSKRHPYRYTP